MEESEKGAIVVHTSLTQISNVEQLHSTLSPLETSELAV